MLELLLTATVIGEYRSFDKLTDDALQMIAAQRGGEASADGRTTLKEVLGQIPAYADVRPGLEQLKQAGFTVATLTNSTEKSATKRLEHAGLRELFDHILSADAVERYKPAREAYEYAAKQLDREGGRDVPGGRARLGHRRRTRRRLQGGLRRATGEGPEPRRAGAPAGRRAMRALAEQLASRHD